MTSSLFNISDRKAFSLVELLVVVAIMLLLASLVGPAANALLKGSQLTQAGQMVGDQLGLARQAALSKNRPIEVRLYQYSDPEVPGEKVGDAGAGKFRAIQCFEVVSDPNAATTTYTPLTKMQRLPATIIIDAGATLSSVIGSSPSKPPSELANYSIPRAGTSYNACTFRFRPDGSTDLSKTGNWFLTVHELNKGDNLTAPPANFVTLQIDPYNGHIKTFRP